MEISIYLIIIALSVMVFIMTFGLLLLKAPDMGNEAWRDSSPSMFNLFRPIINMFIQGVENNMKEAEREMLRSRLHTAGLGYSVLPEEFKIMKWIGLVVGFLIWIFVINVMKDPNVMAVLVVFLGFAYPQIWLNDVIKRRQAEIERQFPFFLELIVLVMRAGLNFASSTSHAVSRIPEGPVKVEFSRFLRDVRTGLSRREALSSLGKRINLSSISNFVSAVNQAEETGGELGKALIIQADQRRSERFLKAEKAANQAPVKMLGPLVLLLFPIVFILIFFPIVIKYQTSGI